MPAFIRQTVPCRDILIPAVGQRDETFLFGDELRNSRFLANRMLGERARQWLFRNTAA